MKKFLNPSSAAVYVLINSLSLFVVYRRLTQDLGIELFGIWSFVLTLNVSFPIFFTGFLGTLVRFIPTFLATDEVDKVKRLAGTSFTLLLLIVVFLLAFCLGIFPYVDHHLVHNRFLDLINGSVPAILAYILSSCITLGLLAILEGHNKVYVKNAVLSLQALALLIMVVCKPTVYHFEETAALFMYVSLGTCAAAFLAMFIFTVVTPFDLLQLDFPLLKTTSSYRTQYFRSTVFGLLLEPLNKTLIVVFAGPSVVALYELSSKFVIQARTVLVSVIFSLIPMFSKKSVLQPELLAEYYQVLFKINAILSNFTFSCLALILPALSYYWLGSIHVLFVQMACVLIIGWYANNLCLPAYTLNAATNGIQLNTRASSELLGVDLLLGLVLGLVGAKEWVVLAWFFSLAYGGIRLIQLYNQKNHVALGSLLNAKDGFQMFFMLLLVVSILIAVQYFPIKNLINAVLYSFVGVIAVGLFILVSNRSSITEIFYRFKKSV